MYVPQKGIDWNAVPLGSQPDAVIARALGVATPVVNTARRRRGIAAFAGPEQARRRLIDWASIPLGERPDSAIAAELGLARRAVGTERMKRGIAPFVGIVLNQEGDSCRSIYEAMYDSWLHAHGCDHEHEVAVPGLPYIADFRVDSRFIEIVGMAAFPRYREKLERKRADYAAAGVDVMWLSPAEVEARFRRRSVPLRFRVDRRCADCGRSTHDLVRKVCRQCYMRRWHRSGQTVACMNCGKSFEARDGQRYCSLPCYWSRNEKRWLPWDKLDELLFDASVAQVARDLGVEPNALHMRLRRRASC